MAAARLALVVGAAGLVAATGAGLARLDAMARVGAGYVAKVACSEIFVAGRPAQTVFRDDFNGIDPLLDRLSKTADPARREVRTALFGLGASRAVWREGYGCAIARGGAPAPLPPLEPIEASDWPTAGDPDLAARLAPVLDAAMADEIARVRALLVIVDGAIVAETYADGFGPDTPLLSWSMAKTVTALMTGAAAARGVLALDDPAPAPEWRGADDPRAAVTWRDLLQMQSGLAWRESYADTGSDVNRMLFSARNAGEAAATKPAEAAPGARWYYSSGTTNLIQRLLRQEMEARGVDYHRFARDALFAPLGAASAVFETDAGGTFVGSSFLYATARDWAKFGQLMLDDGVWKGERLLPEGWVGVMRAPAGASNGWYGGQTWLNIDPPDRDRYFPGVPEDAFVLAGHEGQYVLVIPQTRTVIVRLGMTRGAEASAVAAPVFAAIHAAVAGAGEPAP